MRRVVLWLPIALLAAVGAWLGSRGARGPEGLSVLVTIVDAGGRPVPRAQARARFVDGGWVDADAEGRARVHPVPLAADASPDSPQAIADAIEVRAPWYELPPGGALAIERGDANRFLARATLEPHGVLELVVKTTLLGPARASIETDEPLQRIAAIGGQGVARAGVAAAFRIRPGLRTVTVVVEPEPSLSRDRPVARRRLVVDAPAPGELRRVEIEPEASHPIHGRIHWPEALPSALRVGRVQVVELSRDGGTRTVWGHVDVDASGVFAVGEAAALPYELTLEAPFLETPPALLIGGGGLAEFDALVARPWLHLTHPDLPGTSRPWRVRLLDAAGEVVGAAGPLRIAPGDGALPLVAARDDLVVEVAVPGSNDAVRPGVRARSGRPDRIERTDRGGAGAVAGRGGRRLPDGGMAARRHRGAPRTRRSVGAVAIHDVAAEDAAHAVRCAGARGRPLVGSRAASRR